MIKVFKLLLRVILLAGVSTNPIQAQTPANQVTTTKEDMRRHNNTGKWGLLELLGLPWPY